MICYCLKCRKNTENITSKVEKIKNGRIMFSSNCVAFGSKKFIFITEQKVSGF